MNWVEYNPNTSTYDTKDGTKVAAELVDSVQCLADVFYICSLREEQRRNDESNPRARMDMSFGYPSHG